MATTEQREHQATCAQPVAPWLPEWTWRHGMLAALGAVLGWLFYSDLAADLTGRGWTVVVATLAAAAGLVLASYLPRAGARPALPRDVCGYAPVLMLFVAGWFLTISAGSLWSAPPALLIAGLAVARRTTGSSTCSL
ncbi:MAG: hypothetical protein WCA30_09295 [Dermatophilaceae bacterium]